MDNLAQINQDSQLQSRDTTTQVVEHSNQDSVADITAADITTIKEGEGGKTQHIITTPNPTAEEMDTIIEELKNSCDNTVVSKAVQYNFKKTLDKETQIETVRNAVQLAVNFPSEMGILEIIKAKGKQFELLNEAIEKIINDAVRAILSDDVTLTAASFPLDKVTWEAIANQPKAQRKGGGIPKEVWDGFCQDYTEVMPALTGKTMEQTANAAKILKNKLAAVKTNEPVLQLLVGQLAIYAEHSPNIDDFSECVEFLLGKADVFLSVSDEELLANL